MPISTSRPRAWPATELQDLAADAGLEDLPSHGDGGQQVVARLSAASKAAPGIEINFVLDTTHIQLFDPDGGRSLSAAS